MKQAQAHCGPADAGAPGSDRRSPRRVRAAVALAGALLAAASARADCRLQQFEIPVRIVDHRPLATLTINGTEVAMLVDSGAFFSMLSPSTAEQLKLRLSPLPDHLEIRGYTGPIRARMTRVEKLGLLGSELKKVEFLVGGNELGAGIQGVLGRNILAAGDTEYDLAQGAVRLSFPKGECEKTNLAHWAGTAPVVVVPLNVPFASRDTAIRVDVGVNGQGTEALLDTGAVFTTVTRAAARRAGIQDRDLVPASRAGGAGQGRVMSWTAHVASFELGGEKITDNQLRIDDDVQIEEGVVLGLDYFLSHRIYMSNLQRQVYITWNGGPVFAKGQAAGGSHDTRYAALPPPVANDDAGALARRGAAAIAAQDYPRALQDLNRACELAPGVADCFVDRARLLQLMQQPDAALADLDTALRLAPALGEARLRRAALHASLGHGPAALADLRQLDAVLPPSAAARAAIGELYAEFGQVAEALRQFEFWVSSHPNDQYTADVLANRCWLRTRLDIDLPLALQDCRRALERDESSATIQGKLGWTYLRLGNDDKARRTFEDAIALKPLPFSLYGRGLAQLRLHDAAGAERDLAAARRLKPSIDDDVQQAGFGFASALVCGGAAAPAAASAAARCPGRRARAPRRALVGGRGGPQADGGRVPPGQRRAGRQPWLRQQFLRRAGRLVDRGVRIGTGGAVAAGDGHAPQPWRARLQGRRAPAGLCPWRLVPGRAEAILRVTDGLRGVA